MAETLVLKPKTIRMRAFASFGKRQAFPSTAACALLDKFKPQDGLPGERSLQVKMGTVHRIDALFASFMNGTNNNEITNACECLSKKINYSSKDVEIFSPMLLAYEQKPSFERISGLFLSYLVNFGKDSDYVLNLWDISTPIEFLCFVNKKNLVINGNVGDYLGTWMKQGKIILNGNAGSYVGNGKEGGDITVNGDVGMAPAQEQTGGIVRVNGRISELPNKCNAGKLYQRKRLLVENGVFKTWQFNK